VSQRLDLGADAVADVEEFIYTMVVWGEHGHNATRQWSFEDMRSNFPDYASVVESVNAGAAVPYFENLLGETFHIEASGGYISVRNPTTGEEVHVPEFGSVDTAPYSSRFATGVAAWSRAIEKASHEELLSAFTTGIASIEAFVNAKAFEWNASHPTDILEDTPQRRMSFRRKLEE